MTARKIIVGMVMLSGLGLCGASVANAPQAWSSSILGQLDAWSDRMNDATISLDAGRLRVEVATDRQWAIAAVPHGALPASVGEVRNRVSQVGGGGRWLVRLYGDLRLPGHPTTVSRFEGQTVTGDTSVEIDPRLINLAGSPVAQVQLGVEGPPHAFAVFQSLEFVPAASARASTAIPGQKDIACVDLMPDLPHPYKMMDWAKVAREYDHLAFDFQAKGEYLPLIWLDNTHINNDSATFGLPSYVGAPGASGSNHEGITCMGAVLGATVAGIDKQRQPHDYVQMCEAYFNSHNGSNLVLNNQDGHTGGSFWYELWPHIVFYALADRYPAEKTMQNIVRITADRWCEACKALSAGPDGIANFDHTSLNFETMQPVDNGHWKEPDAAAGVAWLEYAAYTKWHDSKYLSAAEQAIRFLDERKANPYYEVLLPWGALTAARMNAELGQTHDVDKMIKWCFGISDCRGGWGVTLGKWGGVDCDGLVGSVDNQGGYAFAMNTFCQAGALTALARYDTAYARAIGKWMLNCANSARLFYPHELPASHQSNPEWKGDPAGCIAYEGLRHKWDGKSLVATGDPVAMHWGPPTDLGLYGSGYVGLLGGIVHRTSDPAILALDCLATDFYHAPAYPTFLVYNPYPTSKRVLLPVGPGRHDLYDSVSGTFLARGVSKLAQFRIPGDRASVVVLAPAGGKLTRSGGRVLIDGVVVRYRQAPASR
jgi:hypothetical protein